MICLASRWSAQKVPYCFLSQSRHVSRSTQCWPLIASKLNSWDFQLFKRVICLCLVSTRSLNVNVESKAQISVVLRRFLRRVWCLDESPLITLALMVLVLLMWFYHTSSPPPLGVQAPGLTDFRSPDGVSAFAHGDPRTPPKAVFIWFK